MTVLQIPEDMEIDDLKQKLMDIIANYRIQVQTLYDDDALNHTADALTRSLLLMHRSKTSALDAAKCLRTTACSSCSAKSRRTSARGA